MRDWLVAGAVIQGPEGFLLVQNRPRTAPVELWCGGRKVTRLDAAPEAAAALPPDAVQERTRAV